jgi:hypothetical protein
MFKPISFFIMSIGILLMPLLAYADSAQKLVKKGNTAYVTGKYDEALDAYEAAAVHAPESPHIYFNKGTALYQKQEYTRAAEAFKQAAIKTKDIKLETFSKFNSGVCSFREAELLKDSDLNNALEACSQSIRYFQDALELSPEFKEAAENIEMVRMAMKSILDEIKRRKKQQKATQNAAEQIQDIIKKQQELFDRNKTLADEERQKGNSKDLHEKAQDLAKGQKDLQQETRTLAQNMIPPGQDMSEPVQKTKEHLDKSSGQQGAAVEKLGQDQIDPAGAHQEKSLEELENALASLSNEANPQSQMQKQKGDKQQQKNEASAENQPRDSKDSKKEKAPMGQLADDARSILDQEKENKKRRNIYSTGGYHEVDKDW